MGKEDEGSLLPSPCSLSLRWGDCGTGCVERIGAAERWNHDGEGERAGDAAVAGVGLRAARVEPEEVACGAGIRFGLADFLPCVFIQRVMAMYPGHVQDALTTKTMKATSVKSLLPVDLGVSRALPLPLPDALPLLPLLPTLPGWTYKG